MVMGAGGTSMQIAEILILGWYRSWQNVLWLSQIKQEALPGDQGVVDALQSTDFCIDSEKDPFAFWWSWGDTGLSCLVRGIGGQQLFNQTQ